MGKNQKMQKNEQLRELRAKQQQEALAKKKQEQRLILIISICTIALILIAVAISILLIPKEDKNEEITTTEETTTEETTTAEPLPLSYVSMTVKYTDDDNLEHTGDIILELDPNAAPITVANFKKLVGDGFYTGLNFHRVIENFMIQGGAPKDTDTTKYQTIKGEFSANGVNNPILHERGVISMARSGMHYNSQGQLDYGYDTASTQFFIVHETSPHLDGEYAAFGRVISGMELVDGIATMSTNSSDKPLKDAIIVSAKLIDKP